MPEQSDGQKPNGKCDNLNRRQAERAHDQANEFRESLNQTIIDAGFKTCQALILINGGAAIALLTFVGHSTNVGENEVSATLQSASMSIACFAFGALFSTISIGLAYLGNWFAVCALDAHEYDYKHPYVHETKKSLKWTKFAHTFHFVAILTVLLTIGVFTWGVIKTSMAFG